MHLPTCPLPGTRHVKVPSSHITGQPPSSATQPTILGRRCDRRLPVWYTIWLIRAKRDSGSTCFHSSEGSGGKLGCTIWDWSTPFWERRCPHFFPNWANEGGSWCLVCDSPGSGIAKVCPGLASLIRTWCCHACRLLYSSLLPGFSTPSL